MKTRTPGPTIDQCNVDVLIMEQLCPRLIAAAESSESLNHAVRKYLKGLQTQNELPYHYFTYNPSLNTDNNSHMPYINYINDDHGKRVIISYYNSVKSKVPYGSEPQEDPAQSKKALCYPYYRIADYFRPKPATHIKHASGYSAKIVQRSVDALIITNLNHSSHIMAAYHKSVESTSHAVEEYIYKLNIVNTLPTLNIRHKPIAMYIIDEQNPRIVISYYNSEKGEVPYNSGSEGNPAQSGELLPNRAFNYTNPEAATHMEYIKDKTV